MSRVLIVDDEDVVRGVLHAMLAFAGHQVSQAASVDEALALLDGESFDVVISDIVMPGRGGIELLDLVRERSAEAKVILITGAPSYETAAAAIRQGAFDYIAKPISRAAVLRCVEAAANVKALEDEAREYRSRLETLAEERSRQLRDWSARMQSVADQARELGGHRDMAGLAQQVLGLLANATQAEGGSFYVRHGHELELVGGLFATHAARRIPLPAPDQSVVSRLLAEARPMLVADIHQVEGLQPAGPEGHRDGGFLGLPCVGPSHQVEALIFLYNRRQSPFTEQDLAVGRIVAGHVEESMRTAALLQAWQESQISQVSGQGQVLLEQAEHIFRTVRHEIGNALNTLKTTLAVLRTNVTTFDTAKREEYFARCFESFRLAEQMLHALRAFQRFDLVNPERIDLAAFITEKEGWILEAARNRGVRCALEGSASPLWIHADPDALKRILLNLVDNSLAALHGRPAPALTLAYGEVANEAVIRVRDTGCGIAPEHLQRVFQPLFTTKPEGSGMGLAITQRLMAKMGGQVRLHSVLGEGTTAELRLPRATAGVNPEEPRCQRPRREPHDRG